jgi:hypothetical protein
VPSLTLQDNLIARSSPSVPSLSPLSRFAELSTSPGHFEIRKRTPGAGDTNLKWWEARSNHDKDDTMNGKKRNMKTAMLHYRDDDGKKRNMKTVMLQIHLFGIFS